MKKNIALSWGWTWWHVFPLEALQEYLKNYWKYNFYWFWNEDSLEHEIAEQNNIEFIDIPSWKLRRYFDIKNFFEPLKNISGFFFALYYLVSKKIDVVFSKWGYASLPTCLAAKCLWKKILVHESDTNTWLVNKIVSKLATKVFYSFPNDLIDNKKYILSWQILNPKLLYSVRDLKSALKAEQTTIPLKDNFWSGNFKQNAKLEVLVIAWSQGSTIIFENLLKILNNLIDINFTIILGDKNIHFWPQFEKFSNVKIYDFVSQEKLWEIYAKTDIAITRWWATTLWELYYFGIHAIIIPLKNAAWNHQMENAKFFNEKFWSNILEEWDKLSLEIFRLLQKYKDLRKAWLNLDWFMNPIKIIEREI
jgi:UDP-N-acetylglucosamine--N-acetylmuramyl-(pentapeptide) pyrophosphoryl-undecaprenol N-acetylglucosamine transferase